jgi:1,2-diacylglycerol 3-beta-galactosyltransferase
MPTEVLLFMVDAGGGHRNAANALVAASEEMDTPWRFRVENLQHVLEPLDLYKRLTGLSLEDAYNALLRRRWTAYMVPLLRLMQRLIRLMHRPLCARLSAHLAEIHPAAVVSVMPNFNAVIRDCVRSSHPGVPFIVLLTDIADFPPGFWIVPGVERVVVGSDRAAEQAREIGLSPENISRTSGMVLHPRFYTRGGPDARARVRGEMGIGEDEFVLLLLFGGKGSPEMRPLCERLLSRPERWRVVAICGDNPPLLESLVRVAAGSGGRLYPIGFTDRVVEYLAAADVLLTKPGPGSLAEAWHQKVPVVVTCNRHTIPQERYNARFVEERGIGIVVSGWREMPAAAAALAVDPGRRSRLRANLDALPANRAVYEAIDIIDREIAARTPSPAPWPR